MTRSSANFCYFETSQDINGCESAASGVAANELPLRDMLHFDMTVNLGFPFYKFIEAFDKSRVKTEDWDWLRYSRNPLSVYAGTPVPARA